MRCWSTYEIFLGKDIKSDTIDDGKICEEQCINNIMASLLVRLKNGVYGKY